jgi:hypothetical protein
MYLSAVDVNNLPYKEKLKLVTAVTLDSKLFVHTLAPKTKLVQGNIYLSPVYIYSTEQKSK